MSLSEKAKTFVEMLDENSRACKGFLNNCDVCSSPCAMEKWVRLSDHQQEIDEVAKNAAKLLVAKMTELGEQKQKLQQIAVEIENLRRHNHYDAETDKWLIPKRQLFALEKKCEELLQ